MIDFLSNFFSVGIGAILQGLVIGFVVGIAIGYLLRSWLRPGSKESADKKLVAENMQLREEKIRLETKLEDEEGNIDKFKTIAAQVIKEQSSQNDKEIRKTLEPLEKNLKDFRNRIEDLNTKRERDNQMLKEHISTLEQTNLRLSEDATNLTKALRNDKKMQGDWGEVILERLLEASGLQKGREYEVQKTLKDEDGSKMRPDVIIRLPNDKSIIVDSKVSLNSYADYSKTEDEQEAQGFLKSHINAIDSHIKTLSGKDYERLDGINSLEYVLMFIPIEAAFLAAIKEDSTLYERGLRSNIILVTPTTLLATLKVIHNLWRNEHKVQNAMDIAAAGGRLYDKFRGFITDMDKIGQSLGQAQKSYEAANNKLHTGSGNLLNRSAKMRKLVADNGSKDLADTEDDTSIIDNLEEMHSLGVDPKKQLPS